jgi:hypothetical protein
VDIDGEGSGKDFESGARGSFVCGGSKRMLGKWITWRFYVTNCRRRILYERGLSEDSQCTYIATQRQKWTDIKFLQNFEDVQY